MGNDVTTLADLALRKLLRGWKLEKKEGISQLIQHFLPSGWMT